MFNNICFLIANTRRIIKNYTNFSITILIFQFLIFVVAIKRFFAHWFKPSALSQKKKICCEFDNVMSCYVQFYHNISELLQLLPKFCFNNSQVNKRLNLMNKSFDKSFCYQIKEKLTSNDN